MKRTLIVCHTIDAAKRRFHNMIMQNEDAVSRASHTQMKVNIGDTEFEFISQHSSDRIRGQTYHSVFIYEIV